MSDDQGLALVILAFLGAMGGCGLMVAGKPRLAIAWGVLCCSPAFVSLYIKALMG